MSLLRQMMSLKRLHLHAITRLDLSSNQLRHLPLAIFQIESLRVPPQRARRVAHSAPRPTRQCQPPPRQQHKNTVHRCCNRNRHRHSRRLLDVLEELDADHNKLRAITAHVFQLRAVKHLNVANNELDTLPTDETQQRQQQLKSATRRGTADLAVLVQDHPLKTPTNELSSPAWVSEIIETLTMN